jgi:hypothetical protein
VTTPGRRAGAPELAAVKARAKRAWGDLDGVEGFGIGDGVLRVYVRDAGVARRLDDTFDGVAVDFVPVGDIEAR